jgi:hypothetical protein
MRSVSPCGQEQFVGQFPSSCIFVCLLHCFIFFCANLQVSQRTLGVELAISLFDSFPNPFNVSYIDPAAAASVATPNGQVRASLPAKANIFNIIQDEADSSDGFHLGFLS